MESRRLLLAALLSAVVIIIWNLVFLPAPPPPSPETPASRPETSTPEDTSEPVEPAEAAGSLAVDEVEVEAEPLPFAGEAVSAESESQQIVENAGFQAVFTNRGAQLVSLRLKNHLTAEGEPLELIRHRGTDPHLFALVADGERSHRLNQALFVWEEGTTDEGQPWIRFRHSSSLGAAEKVFTWSPRGFLDVEVRVEGRSVWGLVLGPGLRNPEADEFSNRWLARKTIYSRGAGSHETIDPAKQEEDLLVPGTGLRWVALEDNFFLMAAIPESGLREVIVRPVLQRLDFDAREPRFLPLDAEIETETEPVQMLLLQASAGSMHVKTYLGAKQYTQLAKLPYGLEETVNWGWFGVLGKLLYYGLQWIHAHVVANYGWAIVLITILIKVLFFPLTWKSQESMTKMQELNPKVQAIRNKYRAKLKDKQGRPNLEAQRQMNDEVMAVYKSAGVNPASGCLPILLQMPVFFAFYQMLGTAVELRNAPWVAWVRDLSAPDPYYILPILMGVTSITMQRMMPQAPDPMQRRMMQLMPIMFMFFALYFPSGLVLYWLTNNLLTMAQQAVLLRKRRAQQQANEPTKKTKP